MIKVVINADFGGFGLSKEAIDRYCKEKGIEPGEWSKSVWGCYSNFHERDVLRDDEVLVRIVEEMGKKADGDYAALKVVEVPDDVDWYVEEYDGSEWVAERHRTWR